MPTFAERVRGEAIVAELVEAAGARAGEELARVEGREVDRRDLGHDLLGLALQLFLP